MKFLLNVFVLASLGALPRPADAQAGSQEQILCEDVKKPFFTVSCREDGRCSASAARRENSARDFSVPKPAGVKRIFILGGSAAGLLGDGSEISGKEPGLEVINCGVGGYESRRIAGVFKEVLKYEPDLLVILSGNNEGGDYPCGGLSFELRRRAARLLELFYGWKYGDRAAPVLASLKIHEMRLAAMAKEARKRKIPLILCTLPANLRDMPPSGFLPLEKESFAAGMAAFGKKDFEKAGGRFKESLKKDPNDLFSWFYLAKTLEARRQFKEARDAYLRALELDPRPGRSSPARNRMIRKVAAERGAGLCDLEPAFYAVSKNSLPGFEQFSDGMHWRPAYNQLVWAGIARTARAMGLTGLAFRPPRPSDGTLAAQDLRQVFSYSLARLDNAFSISGLLLPAGARAGELCERALAGMDSIEDRRPGLLERTALSGEAFEKLFIKNAWSYETAARLERLRPLFLAHLAELYRRRGNFKGALPLIERVIAVEPERSFFRLVRILALLGLDRNKEAEQEAAVLYASPDFRPRVKVVAGLYGLPLPDRKVPSADAGLSKRLSDDGVSAISAGKPEAAESFLARAVSLNPANAEALLSLCSAQFSGKEFLKAFDSCDRAEWSAEGYYPEARQGMVTNARDGKARILAAMKRARPL